MKIDQTRYIWDFLFNRRIGINFSREPLHPRTVDVIQISDTAKRKLKNDYIEKTLNSGEPMVGITYEEYCDYYYDKHGYHSKDNMRQEYKQALKGDNASLREKEWRTNPDYSVPIRLFSSSEVTADREAAFEKYRNGEKLEEWEVRLLNTFPDAEEGCRRLNEANNEITARKLQDTISSALFEAGAELSENEALDIEVWGYSISVSGNIDNDKLQHINDILSENAISFQNWYHRYHENESKIGGLPLVFLWSAEKIFKDEGSGSVFDIGKDENGNFTGLPNDLGEFIKENAIGEFGKGIDDKYADRRDDIKKALYMRETFNSVIETVKNGDYDRLKAMTCKLTYKNGILSC